MKSDLLKNALLQKVLANYQANLYFLRKHYPSLFEVSISAGENLPFYIDDDCSVVVIGEGEVDVLLKDEKCFFNDQLKKGFLSLAAEVGDSGVKDFGSKIEGFFSCTDIVAIDNINSCFNKQVLDEDFQIDMSRDGACVSFLMGGGYGWILNKIVDDYSVRHLILCESDLNCWNNLLFFVDLQDVYDRFVHKGGALSLVVRTDEKELVRAVSTHATMITPPFMLKKAPFVLSREIDPSMNNIFNGLLESILHLHQDCSSWSDAIPGLRNALADIKNNMPTAGFEKDPGGLDSRLIFEEVESIRVLVDSLFSSVNFSCVAEGVWCLANLYETIQERSSDWPCVSVGIYGSLLNFGRVFYDGVLKTPPEKRLQCFDGFKLALQVFFDGVVCDLNKCFAGS